MLGEMIYARTLSQNRHEDKSGNLYQYHPRSDHHSKIASWVILFDVFQGCKLLRDQIRAGYVGFGINHQMSDYKSGRKKNLDLVLCRPGGSFRDETFQDLAKKYRIKLLPSESEILSSLPRLTVCPVGTTLLAVEAKACMTEHSKARPRLYDELASSFQIMNADTNSTIAAAHVTINIHPHFISPTRQNKTGPTSELQPTLHRQPESAIKVSSKIAELPRRSAPSEFGFDAIGITFVECANDLSPIGVARNVGNDGNRGLAFDYNSFVTRLIHLYETRFSSLHS